MALKVMLAPNLHRSMLIDRVVIVGESAEKQHLVVLSIDGFKRDPLLLQSIGGGRAAAIFWNVTSILIFLGGVSFSFLWHWWAWLLGIVIAAIVQRASRQSTAEFAVAALSRDSSVMERLIDLGLVWTAPAASVVSEA